jgi:hypothetical protein
VTSTRISIFAYTLNVEKIPVYYFSLDIFFLFTVIITTSSFSKKVVRIKLGYHWGKNYDKCCIGPVKNVTSPKCVKSCLFYASQTVSEAMQHILSVYVAKIGFVAKYVSAVLMSLSPSVEQVRTFWPQSCRSTCWGPAWAPAWPRDGTPHGARHGSRALTPARQTSHGEQIQGRL